VIAAAVYSDDGIEQYDDLASAKAATGTTWVRVDEASAGELDAVAAAFDIHSLAIEDVSNDVRPKTEEFTEYTLTLLKTVELARGEQAFGDEVSVETVGLFVGPDWLVTLSTGPDAPVDRVWEAVVRGDERLIQHGPDFTAYRVADVVVDEYFELLDRIEDQIERVEDEVVVSTDVETLEAINGLRRDLLAFRKVAWPTREAIGVLARGDVDHVAPATEKYFRDVYDHVVQVVDLTVTYRDLTSGARDIYLNSVSQSTNEVMKVLTVIATIFLPLTFIAGVYGMNFDGSPYNMPELSWAYGYPAVLLGMTVLGVGMLAYFRHVEYI
jgi:magnesium transporter